MTTKLTTAQVDFLLFQRESLAKQIEHIRGKHVTQSSAEITKTAFSELYNVVIGGADPRNSTDFWRQEGYPAIARAFATEIGLAKFREALASPDYAYVTNGHSVSPNSYHIYRRDTSSPTGRLHAAPASKEGYEGEAARKMMEEHKKETRTSGSYTHDYRG